MAVDNVVVEHEWKVAKEAENPAHQKLKSDQPDCKVVTLPMEVVDVSEDLEPVNGEEEDHEVRGGGVGVGDGREEVVLVGLPGMAYGI